MVEAAIDDGTLRCLFISSDWIHGSYVSGSEDPRRLLQAEAGDPLTTLLARVGGQTRGTLEGRRKAD